MRFKVGDIVKILGYTSRIGMSTSINHYTVGLTGTVTGALRYISGNDWHYTVKIENNGIHYFYDFELEFVPVYQTDIYKALSGQLETTDI